MSESPPADRFGLGAQALAIATASLVFLLLNTRLDEPPRYDGAGYSVLARSIASGRGYREIDRLQAPRHSHFPPGYPALLAALWSITGVSATSAHLFSIACTVGASLLFWIWYRAMIPPRAAFLLALALALNWRWVRDGSAIRSEPPFLLLVGCGALLTVATGRRGRPLDAVLLGFTVGAATLTRHVAAATAVAVVLHLLLAARKRLAVVVSTLWLAILAPWIVWVANVGGNTQVSLVPTRGITEIIASNGLFYLRRIPDVILGPIIEVFTVFRPGYSGLATLAAALLAIPIALGWSRLIRDRATRPAALVPIVTILLLLIWPFTEAGRFLVPLVPFILIGGYEGLRGPGRRIDPTRAALAILLVGLPYSLYSTFAGRAEAERRTHAGFDAAVAEIGRRTEPPGPILSRHPGEIFWSTGRTGECPPPLASPEEVASLIDRSNAAFVVVDQDRFANAPTGPLERFVTAMPGRVRLVWSSEGNPSTSLYLVAPANPD